MNLSIISYCAMCEEELMRDKKKNETQGKVNKKKKIE